MAKASKQLKDRHSEYRQIVALNPIEQLKANAVELISTGRVADVRADSSELATYELVGWRCHDAQALKSKYFPILASSHSCGQISIQHLAIDGFDQPKCL